MSLRETTKRRGIRMAMQVAALAVGAGGAGMAFAAEADVGAAPPGGERGEPTTGAPKVEPVQTSGWSCWGGPISRGPAAPPCQTADFDALLAEVPA